MSNTTDINIRSAMASDAEALARIYNHYIRTSVITFEESEVNVGDLLDRMERVHQLSLPWLVAESAGVVVGYAYASKWKDRSAYRFSVESTVYLDPARTGQAIGSRLYRELIKILGAKSMHTVIGGIAMPNDASVALHERLGFTKVAHFKDVGFKFERWIDVGYWQLNL